MSLKKDRTVERKWSQTLRTSKLNLSGHTFENRFTSSRRQVDFFFDGPRRIKTPKVLLSRNSYFLRAFLLFCCCVGARGCVFKPTTRIKNAFRFFQISENRRHYIFKNSMINEKVPSFEEIRLDSTFKLSQRLILVIHIFPSTSS